MIARYLPLLAFCAFCLGVQPARSQCSDPPTPRNGFVPKHESDKSLVFSDGYRTLADIALPTATPGPCGWPLLVRVHPLGPNRKWMPNEVSDLAAAGYAVVSFEVRGQGDARALNPGRGSKLWALDEWIDLAEVIEWMDASYPVDANRVAVFGVSQGAVYAWAAAAYSGRALPANPRRSRVFPKIACAVPLFLTPDVADMFVRGGQAFLQHLPALAFVTQNAVTILEPGFRTKLIGFLDKDDPRGMYDYLRSVPGKNFMPELERTTVPTLATLGWRDNWIGPDVVLDLFERMPPSTPRRLYMMTGPHGEPENDNQNARALGLTKSWFARYLKNASEPVERGSPFLIAATPGNAQTYANRTSLWPHRMESAWPPTDVQNERLYLTRGAQLTFFKAEAGGSSSIRNDVPTGYGIRDYLTDLGHVAKVVTRIPLSSQRFESGQFPQDTEIAGFPRLSVVVDSSERRFMLGAWLVAVSPQGEELVLARGGGGVDLSKNGPQRVELRLGAVAAVVPAGSRLRLELRNHDLQRPNGLLQFYGIPVFKSYLLSIKHDATNLAWIDVPVRPRVLPDIATQTSAISLTSPARVDFEIRSSSDLSSSLYIVLLGFSGQGPAIALPSGSKLWLAPDAGTVAFLQAIQTPVLRNFAGLLDTNGGASCALDLSPFAPLPLGLLGAYVQVAPTFLNSRGVEAGAGVRLRLR